MKEIKNLWPDVINLNARSPALVLHEQCLALETVTGGLIKARIGTLVEDGGVRHNLIAYSPVIEKSHVLLSLTHTEAQVYPVRVISSAVGKRRAKNRIVHGKLQEEIEMVYPTAASDTELMNYLLSAFNSEDVKAALTSMIAMSNEKLQASSDNGNSESVQILSEGNNVD